MKYHSEKVADSGQQTADSKSQLNAKRYTLNAKSAFSLIEVVAALIILALIVSTVLSVYNRCMASAADSALRRQAFEAARENMEALLAGDSVREHVEFGQSDKYPEIQWQRTVETFYEPITARMWIRAICSAEYTDTDDVPQTVELTHWLTDLTKEDVLKILEQEGKGQELLAGQIIGTLEDAAAYAGVDAETIEQWVENGMPRAEDGSYTKGQLDLYKSTDGKPTAEERKQQAQADMDSVRPTEREDRKTEPKAPEEELIYGYTMEELMQMDFAQVWEIFLKNR